MKIKKHIIPLPLLAVVTTIAFNGGNIPNFDKSLEVNAYYSPTETYTNYDKDTYYSSISSSLSGDTLLANLQSLNSKKRQKTMGYSSMGTSTNTSPYIYTDYDPDNVKYDKNGQPYNTSVLSFYSGKSVTGYNKEHVWPNSRGGGKVDSDIHMPRPTIQSENSNRGNSSYVEGMAHSKNGWDPVTAFGKDNCYMGEDIRGECARIIFYCMVASSSLSLEDDANINYNNSIGKLSDLLKWNLNYAVNEREERRNEGAEYLQGNRNPFVDHPEYACKIWGNTNSTTKSICSSQEIAPTSISLNKTSLSIYEGGTSQLSATANPSSSSNSFVWSSSNTNVATVSTSGLVTALKLGQTTITVASSLDSSIKATCLVSVTEPVKTELISISASDISLNVNATEEIAVTNNPSNAYPSPTYSYSSSDTSIVTVSNNGVVKGISKGEAIITISASQVGYSNKTTSIKIVVEENKEQTVTINTGKGGSPTSASDMQVTFKQDYASFIIDKNNFDHGANNYVCNSDNNETRVYNGTSVTFKMEENYAITNIIITPGGKKALNGLNNGTWTNIDNKSLSSDGVLTITPLTNVNQVVCAPNDTSGISSVQITYSSIDTYDAYDFASDLLTKTETICSSSTNKTNDLKPIWIILEDDCFSKLDDDEKQKLIDSNAIYGPNGTTIEQAMDRYDYIVANYKLDNFISRNINTNNKANYLNKDNKEYVALIIITFSIATFGGVTLLISKKNKEE